MYSGFSSRVNVKAGHSINFVESVAKSGVCRKIYNFIISYNPVSVDNIFLHCILTCSWELGF